ncbi:unnamed protein product [Cyprideis torosa]|uniref:Uncharacterized protein n=1 Tax=Cyprideis torosa TaxID=163714 RepID=A0A7R8WCR6_9CRUS|nr:unnamed protein product [Cyprideis torosa]CAG0887617.1 unnamed protein product [Cyprideis torosa]
MSELEKIRKKLKKEMEELDNKDYRKEKKAEQEEKLANLKEEVKSLKRDLKKDKEAKAKAEDQKKRGPDESEDDEEDEVDDPEADEEDPKIKYKKDLKRFAAAKKNEKKKEFGRRWHGRAEMMWERVEMEEQSRKARREGEALLPIQRNGSFTLLPITVVKYAAEVEPRPYGKDLA